ncbi:hypothetical protein HTZ77_43230 [Nonomuraea sp. SMC257]|uniref:Uncharacterized protein n=1 Tax=Nonomuraea montanisoli TaxID=2741721 RepID=A0A7Y6IHE7_9ACTN|nr:hypothetical protein [Nonomuraea montanisoli]NUW38166.1 hypothetical protein [Nonomuraea montanisoli]
MKMIKKAVAVSAVAAVLAVAVQILVLIFVPIYGSAAVDLTTCKIQVAQQHPVLEKEVTPLLARLFPAGSVTAIDREDNCQFEPLPDLIPSPSASVVATVADDAQHVRDALAAMHREGWRYVEPIEELDLPQTLGLRKEFSHGTVEMTLEYDPRVSGGSGVRTWEFFFEYS